MKQKSVLALALAVLLLVCGCASKNQVPEGMDEIALIQKAHEAIATVNAREYDKFYQMFREDLRVQFTADQLKDAIDAYLNPAGPFDSYKKETIVTQKDQADNYFAVIAVIAKHQNRNIQYTVVFDTGYNLTSFYLK